MKITNYEIDENSEHSIDIEPETEKDNEFINSIRQLKEGEDCLIMCVHYDKGMTFYMRDKKD